MVDEDGLDSRVPLDRETWRDEWCEPHTQVMNLLMNDHKMQGHITGEIAILRCWMEEKFAQQLVEIEKLVGTHDEHQSTPANTLPLPQFLTGSAGVGSNGIQIPTPQPITSLNFSQSMKSLESAASFLEGNSDDGADFGSGCNGTNGNGNGHGYGRPRISTGACSDALLSSNANPESSQDIGHMSKSHSLGGVAGRVKDKVKDSKDKVVSKGKDFLVKKNASTPTSRSTQDQKEKRNKLRSREMAKDWDEKMEEKVMQVMEEKRKIHVDAPDTLLNRCVQGSAFSLVVAVAIATNAIIMGLDADESMDRALSDPEKPRSQFFVTADIIFTTFFIVELVLRVIAERLSFLLGTEWLWNIFDACLVVVSVMEAVTAGSMEQGSSTGYIRLLKIVRMVRVLRIVRIMRFFRELRRMCMSIISSMAAFTWALVLLVLIEYVFAILFMQAGVDNLTTDNIQDGEVRDQWKHFYGTVASSFFTLTKAISGGEDWGIMTDPLKSASIAYLWAFVLYVLFVVFGVLNVLTGVFLDSASEVLRQDRDWLTQDETIRQEKFMKNFHALFKELDLSHSGRLDWEDFMDAMEHVTTQAFFTANGLDVNDAHTLFALMAGKDHTIDVSHFIKGCSRLRGSARSVHVMKLLKDAQQIRAEVRQLGKNFSQAVQTHPVGSARLPLDSRTHVAVASLTSASPPVTSASGDLPA
mmetsp:Transcript_11302/g.25983  ORF Transcript_11302/g.25983 Transcript_11302/m.25983 type:complete len:697 (+) Transcript_11302:182-2272(+)